MELNLYKIRSASACISDSYGWFTCNLKAIIRHTWLAALVYSACAALLLIVVGSIYDANNIANGAVEQMGVTVLLGFVSTLAAEIWLNARFFTMLNSLTTRANSVRLSLLLLVGVAIMVVYVVACSAAGAAFAVSAPLGDNNLAVFGAIGLALGVGLLLLLALLPLAYTSMKYIMEPDMKLRAVFGRPFRTGLGRWGYLFGTGVLTLVIYGVIDVVLMIPATIISTVQQLNTAGVIGGDDSGLPAMFTVLMFLTYVVTCFLQTYVSLWSVSVLCHAYGSIEARIRDNSLIQNS